MSEFVFKRGNTVVLTIPIKDANGDTVTNLAAATEATFVLKKTETGTALFTLKKTTGEIVMDTPNSGDCQITISPTNMTQIPKRYYFGLKIQWSASEIYEVHVFVNDIETESFRIKQNIVT